MSDIFKSADYARAAQKKALRKALGWPSRHEAYIAFAAMQKDSTAEWLDSLSQMTEEQACKEVVKRYGEPHYYVPYIPLQMVSATDAFPPKVIEPIGFKTRYGIVKYPFSERMEEFCGTRRSIFSDGDRRCRSGVCVRYDGDAPSTSPTSSDQED